jgi:hypothetical protein
VTVGELLDGQRLDITPVRQTSVTYKRAPKALSKVAEHRPLDFGEEVAAPAAIEDVKKVRKKPRRK